MPSITVHTMQRLVFLLVFLLDRRYYSTDQAKPLRAQAFSILPQSRRIHETRSIPTTRTIQPTDSSPSMTALGTSSESTEIPKVGKDGLYHITTEGEYR